MGRIKELGKDIKSEITCVPGEVKKEIIFNIPNSLSLLRLILTFVFIYLLFAGYSNLWLIIVFAVAAISDFFDGMLARRLKQTTRFGARMDQFVDRIFTIGVIGSIILYVSINNQVFTNILDNIFVLSPKNIILLLFLTCSREIVGGIGLLIILVRKKPWYKVRFIGKLTTFIQGITIGAIILNFPWTIYLALATAVIGVVAGFDYIKYAIGNEDNSKIEKKKNVKKNE